MNETNYSIDEILKKNTKVKKKDMSFKHLEIPKSTLKIIEEAEKSKN